MRTSRILFIIFLFISFTNSAISSPPILFFKKIIYKKQNAITFFEYEVKKGEYIYSILKSLKIPKEKFGYIINEIKKLNPQIKDINKLRVGEEIKIPTSVFSTKTQSSSFNVKNILIFQKNIL